MKVINETYARELSQFIFSSLQKNESAFLNFYGEHSQFIRLNQCKVRQNGVIDDAFLEIIFISSFEGEHKKNTCAVQLTGEKNSDQATLSNILPKIRLENAELPPDPFATLPKEGKSSTQILTGNLPSEEEVIQELTQFKQLDIAGIFAAGRIFRGMSNSKGQFCWFETQNFNFDYSVFNSQQKAVKSSYAGSNWDYKEFIQNIQHSEKNLKMLNLPSRKIDKGKYRVYLAPAALGDIIAMLSWGAVSEASIQQGDSALKFLRTKEKNLSPLFSLVEDFNLAGVPQFNEQGEIAAEQLTLIEKGALRNTWVSSRSESEYGVKSNGANASETLRAASVLPGTLKEEKILSELGTGLYLSNLHYLNWSDQPNGRLTGMTRYACFWVENGKVVAPIENLRFDDTLFNLLGDKLIDLTEKRECLAEAGTYTMRSLGSMTVPGALLSEMEFTL